jgi:putative photosynthetic complex assembly protein
VFAPGTNGFVRGALRGLVRERKRRLIGPETPFLLVRRGDGRLQLEDRATGAVVDLAAFGPSNIEPFRRLMSLERAS